MIKIKKNDEVMIISGKDKGKRGKIERILTRENQIVVGGLNTVKRHLKRKSEKEQSQIITIAKPLPISRVMVVCPHCNRPARIGIAISEDKKERFCKKCKKTI